MVGLLCVRLVTVDHVRPRVVMLVVMLVEVGLWLWKLRGKAYIQVLKTDS